MEFLDILAELTYLRPKLIEKFTQLNSVKSFSVKASNEEYLKNLTYIIDSLLKHPESSSCATVLQQLNLNHLDPCKTYQEIIRILENNTKVKALFTRLWSYFFPLLNSKTRKHSVSQQESLLSDSSITGNKIIDNPTVKKTTPKPSNSPFTLYSLVNNVKVDDKTVKLLKFLDEAVKDSGIKGQMQYILRSLKNHSDSSAMFYPGLSGDLNLLEIVERLKNGLYSSENSETLKLDIESVFSKFYVLYPNDKTSLSRAKYHFDYLWNYFFPYLSSRTRKRKLM